eukprot:g80985.t1
MSGLDYTALQEPGSVVVSPRNALRTAAGAIAVGLLTLGTTSRALLYLFSGNNEPSTEPFKPKLGIDAVTIRPQGPGLVSLLPPPAFPRAPTSIFIYGEIPPELAVGVKDDAWLYGAKLGNGTMAIITGRPGDVIKGKLVSGFRIQLMQNIAERTYGYYLDSSRLRTGKAPVVKRDGSAEEVYFYYQVDEDPWPFATQAGRDSHAHGEATFTPPRVVIFGGCGRVGQSTYNSLRLLGFTNTQVVGRTRPKATSRLSDHFIPLGCKTVQDFRPGSEAMEAIRSADILVNTMGPFQGRNSAELLEALLEDRRKRLFRAIGPLKRQFYMDVSDGFEYAMKCKALGEEAKQLGVIGVTSGGIFPGLSNLLVADMLARYPQENANVRLYYFTAGTGGVGTTILTASFLLLSEECHVWENGHSVTIPACSDVKIVDFRKWGNVTVVNLNLPEATSLGLTLKLNSSKAYFGTAPEAWNHLMISMAKNVPNKWLSDRSFCSKVAAVSILPNRVVDKFVGSSVEWKVEVGKKTVDFAHRDLEESVGLATALLTQGIWEQGEKAPLAEDGIYFPEEYYNTETRDRIFRRAIGMGCDIRGRSLRLIVKRQKLSGLGKNCHVGIFSGCRQFFFLSGPDKFFFLIVGTRQFLISWKNDFLAGFRQVFQGVLKITFFRVLTKIAGSGNILLDPCKMSSRLVPGKNCRVLEIFAGSRQNVFSPGPGKNCRVLANLSGSRKCFMISCGPARRFTGNS